MFGQPDEELLASLERMRMERCGYGAGPDERCDCKFGASGKGEETGCPELRQAIKLIAGQRDEVRVMEKTLEASAANKMAAIKRIVDS